MNDTALKNTPLYNKHIEAGARMVPFSGWSMPVQYTGIIDEHIHTRRRAGLFDICHMGEFVLKGSSAEADLGRLVTCRIDNMPVGRCRYGFLLNAGGGIIDDLIVFKLSEDEFMLVVNAGTVAKDAAWIEEHISDVTVFTDESEKTAKLDIQGPFSGEVMASITGRDVVKDLKRYCFTYFEVDGMRVLLSRTGYTGELGYELFFPTEYTEKFWNMFLACSTVKPVGLGARDTLRLEMGYSLYGNDIDEKHTPFEGNLGKFIFFEKDFIGKEPLLAQKRKGVKRVLSGFICEGRRSARKNFTVLHDGENAGEVTSGAFSPCLKRGIGLCYIDRELTRDGRKIVLSDGKIEIKATIKSIPVYEK